MVQYGAVRVLVEPPINLKTGPVIQRQDVADALPPQTDISKGAY